MNLAHEFARSLGMTVQECREHYDDACIDFAGDLHEHLKAKGVKPRMAFFNNTGDPRWRYHCAVQVGDHIHDLWEPDEAVPFAMYCTRLMPEFVDYPAEQTA